MEELLGAAKIPPSLVQILPSLQADLWTRDYGPITLKTSEGPFLVADGYSTRGAMAPSSGIPAILAQRFKYKKERIPLVLERGNLLSNGAGLCLTTTRLLDWNRMPHPQTVESATSILQRHLGATQVVFLDPLENERTGHVDLFATFTSPDTVVVAEARDEDDPINAQILDRNAERLSRVVTACGPLQVHRVPMPARSGRRPP